MALHVIKLFHTSDFFTGFHSYYLIQAITLSIKTHFIIYGESVRKIQCCFFLPDWLFLFELHHNNNPNRICTCSQLKSKWVPTEIWSVNRGARGIFYSGVIMWQPYYVLPQGLSIMYIWSVNYITSRQSHADCILK